MHFNGNVTEQLNRWRLHHTCRCKCSNAHAATPPASYCPDAFCKVIMFWRMCLTSCSVPTSLPSISTTSCRGGCFSSSVTEAPKHETSQPLSGAAVPPVQYETRDHFTNVIQDKICSVQKSSRYVTKLDSLSYVFSTRLVKLRNWNCTEQDCVS